MADSELRQVRGQRRRIVKSKMFAELNSVGRARNHSRFLPYLLVDFVSLCLCTITYTAIERFAIAFFSPGSATLPSTFALFSVCSSGCHSSPSLSVALLTATSP